MTHGLQVMTMRILDEKNDKAVQAVMLFLRPSEAAELRDSLTALLEGGLGGHEHVSSDDYQKEVTVCLYDEGHLEGMDERSKRLIREDV
jgi:hypothetical protein